VQSAVKKKSLKVGYIFYLAANRKLIHPGCYHNFEGNLPAHVKIAVQSPCNRASIIFQEQQDLFNKICRYRCTFSSAGVPGDLLIQSLTVLCDKLILFALC